MHCQSPHVKDHCLPSSTYPQDPQYRTLTTLPVGIFNGLGKVVSVTLDTFPEIARAFHFMISYEFCFAHRWLFLAESYFCGTSSAAVIFHSAHAFVMDYACTCLKQCKVSDHISWVTSAKKALLRLPGDCFGRNEKVAERCICNQPDNFTGATDCFHCSQLIIRKKFVSCCELRYRSANEEAESNGIRNVTAAASSFRRS